MAKRRERERLCNSSTLKILLAMALAFLIGHVIGPPLSCKLRAAFLRSQPSCPECPCDCSLKVELLIPEDCRKNDPEMSQEMERDAVDLLAEELQLQRTVASETLEHTRALVEDTARATMHYQREAEKCSLGVEACEEARERAEAALVEERRLSQLWERRAKELG